MMDKIRHRICTAVRDWYFARWIRQQRYRMLNKYMLWADRARRYRLDK